MTLDDTLQLALAAFGVAAILMAMSNDAWARKWAPVVGLLGQPAWLWFAMRSGAWGVMALTVVYTAAYLGGFALQWWPGRALENVGPPPDWRFALAALHASAAPSGDGIPLVKLEQDDANAERAALQAEIAHDAAVCEIESYCPRTTVAWRLWYDTERAAIGPGDSDPEIREGVDRAARYLELCGELVRHAPLPHLVRIAP